MRERERDREGGKEGGREMVFTWASLVLSVGFTFGACVVLLTDDITLN